MNSISNLILSTTSEWEILSGQRYVGTLGGQHIWEMYFEALSSKQKLNILYFLSVIPLVATWQSVTFVNSKMLSFNSHSFQRPKKCLKSQ